MAASNRLTVVAASLVLALSCGVLGSYFYLQHKAQNMPVVDRLAAPDPALVAKTEAEKEARILKFRTQFATWAKAHQSELRVMMLAQPEDLAAWRKVSLALPYMPSRKQDGVDMDDFVTEGTLANPETIWCEWSHMGLGAKAARPELEEELKQGNLQRYNHEEKLFRLKRDFPVIWVTSSWSKKQYALWVSGRVTYAEDQLDLPNEKKVLIASAYDFLPKTS